MTMKHPSLTLRDWWRFPRVAWYLFTRPRDIVRYITQGLPNEHTPLSLGMPWWSFGAVDAVKDFIRPDMEVFEFGSGGSSIFLAPRSRRVTCVEDSEIWSDLVRKEAEVQGLKNLDVLTRPYDFGRAEQFGDSDYLRAICGSLYDIIVVDGQEESVQVRPECFWTAEDYIKPGGVIVVDDSWRYPQLKAMNKAKRWNDYKGVGFCRRGVTSTCIFSY
jgi:hypothetical protein